MSQTLEAPVEVQEPADETFEQQGKTILKKVRIGIEEPGRTWTVTGNEGEMAQESKDVELRGSVVIISSDGLRLETSRLYWVGNDQLACELGLSEEHPSEPYLRTGKAGAGWPLPNVWSGVSVEDQPTADERTRGRADQRTSGPAD